MPLLGNSTIFSQLYSISLRTLINSGFLKQGNRSGTIWWSSNGVKTGSVGVSVNIFASGEVGTMTLSYSHNGGEEREYYYELISRPSNLGPGRGRVWYFICPVTGNLCRKLYQENVNFVSRSALPGVLYSLQADCKIMRLAEPDPGYWPKGRKKTYKGKITRAYATHLRKRAKYERANKMIAKMFGVSW